MTFEEFFYRDLRGPSQDRRYLTDKGDLHNYISGYYTHEFGAKRHLPVKILEIGLAYGGSARLWKDWFQLGQIVVIEHDPRLITEIDGVTIVLADAYLQETVNRFPDDQFDYIIDDGPHTFISQLFAVKHWVNKLKPDGKLIVEDVSDPAFIEQFQQNTPYVNRTIDLRHTLHRRYDDIIFEVTKRVPHA